jgi:nicotinate-nucleotide adenylyltransferase
VAAIGLLGGTFDPIHYGHLIIAEATRDQLGLDRIEFLPANDPPHKPDAAVSPARDRIAMVKVAIENIPYFDINCIEMERIGPSYTVDTLERLAERRRDDDFFFIIGGDSLRDFPTWHSPERILQLASLAVIDRPGAAYDLELLETVLPGLRARTTFIEAPLLDISATTLRTRCADGRSIRFQTPDAVIDYITSNALYR